MSELNAVKLSPAFKDYLWGGTKLKTLYNKKSNLDIVAESWELSAHKDGQSIVMGGEYDGLTLNEYIEKAGKEILGTNAEKFEYFPILIKFIDAQGSLSVQVHPDDEYALANEGEYGKTEMWYILDCEEGATLYYGFAKDVTKQEYEEAIRNNTLTEILNAVPVHKGDVFFIEAGTVHAIGEGIIICEIQQNSNTTYRVYDYNRKDKDGNTRPLHIEKAVEVSNLKKSPELKAIANDKDVVLAQCKYFTVRRLKVAGSMGIDIDKSSFHSLIVAEGSGEVMLNGEKTQINKGDSVFVPAQNGKYTVDGQCEIILSYV